MAKQKRPPVVAVLGHVDHGKTSLLDAIRESEVQSGEAGGITQSIGAYQVDVKGRRITFIDTPGHEAFTTMRARGGQAADLVVLVVAANDGVQAQTIEAIDHAKVAKVPIVVAVNKVDLRTADPERVKADLSKHGVLVEGYGGEVVVVETSATKKTGIQDLLEAILSEADRLDLRVDAKAEPSGVIIESYLDERRGPIATVIVQRGTLRTQDVILAGDTYAKVKALNDWLGRRFKAAEPSAPAEVLGFKDLPEAGVRFEWRQDEKSANIEAQKVGEQRKVQEARQREMSPAEKIRSQFAETKVRKIAIILKSDASGSLEAVHHSIEKLQTDEVEIDYLHEGIGSITEADILLASSAQGVVLGFNVGIEKSAEAVARQERVIYRTYDVIYHLLKELEDVITGELKALTPTVFGKARVKQIFELSDGTHIAGCEVVQGVVKKGHKIQLLRGEDIVGEARIVSLRLGKEVVGKVGEGNECGIGMKPELELREGDIIQAVSS